MPTEAEASVPTEDWPITLYVAVDTWWRRAGHRLVPPRSGPAPTMRDQDLIALALAREVLARPSERAWRAEVAADRGHLFPRVPPQSEWNRRVRWLWGAFEHRRAFWVGGVPLAPGGWAAIDTAPLPIAHPSRVRPPTRSCSGDWVGVGPVAGARGLAAHLGWCAALARRFFGFRRALRTGLTDGLIRGWAIVPAAVDERLVAGGVLAGDHDLGLLTDQGFRSAAWGRCWAAESGVVHLLAPSHRERATHSRPSLIEAFVRAFRNRIETTTAALKERFHLEQHHAKRFWGFLTRTATKMAAHTIARLWPLGLIPFR
jgi:hypothetical protein